MRSLSALIGPTEGARQKRKLFLNWSSLFVNIKIKTLKPNNYWNTQRSCWSIYSTFPTFSSVNATFQISILTQHSFYFTGNYIHNNPLQHKFPFINNKVRNDIHICIHSLFHGPQNWAHAVLRCFCSFIGVRLWEMYLIGRDLDGHTCHRHHKFSAWTKSQ